MVFVDFQEKITAGSPVVHKVGKNLSLKLAARQRQVSFSLFLCGAHVSGVCSEFFVLLTAATVQFLFNVYGCGGK